MTCKDVQMALKNLEQSAEDEPTIVLSSQLYNAIIAHGNYCPSCNKLFEKFEGKFADKIRFSQG
jgi:hypothetical protein